MHFYVGIEGIGKESKNIYFVFSESDVMNLISVDCPNLQKALRFMHFPWSCPLQIFISLYFLYDILKGAMIPGKEHIFLSIYVEECLQ